jgi:hypothetical protein
MRSPSSSASAIWLPAEDDFDTDDPPAVIEARLALAEMTLINARLMPCEGANGCVIASRARQTSFSHVLDSFH